VDETGPCRLDVTVATASQGITHDDFTVARTSFLHCGHQDRRLYLAIVLIRPRCLMDFAPCLKFERKELAATSRSLKILNTRVRPCRLQSRHVSHLTLPTCLTDQSACSSHLLSSQTFFHSLLKPSFPTASRHLPQFAMFLLSTSRFNASGQAFTRHVFWHNIYMYHSRGPLMDSAVTRRSFPSSNCSSDSP
jgi:hypothetical protein